MRKDHTGEKFGRLTVIGPADDIVSDAGYHTAVWKCKCDCGNLVNVRGKCLTQGVTKSCGCLQRDSMSARASKHHGSGTRLYAIWNSMRQRCNNPRSRAYQNYGGRGISICPEWDDYDTFRKWAYSAGYDDGSPRGTHTLDRIDVNGQYSPDNCRWTTMKAQSSNKRDTIYLSYMGQRKTLTDWSNETGIAYSTLWKRRLYGFSPERILDT